MSRAIAKPRSAAAMAGGGAVSGAAMITTYFLIFTGHIGPGGAPSPALGLALLPGGTAASVSALCIAISSMSQD